MKQRHIDHAWKRIGMLEVVEYRGNSKWLCRCDCGQEILVGAQRIASGGAVSCGCKRREARDDYRKRMDHLYHSKALGSIKGNL